MIIGGNDGWPMDTPAGQRVQVGDDDWIAEYARRAAAVMSTFQGDGRAVYWSGPPTARAAKMDTLYRKINRADAAAADALVGAVYVDLYSGTAVDGRYSEYVQDGAKRVKARQPDGIHWSLDWVPVAGPDPARPARDRGGRAPALSRAGRLGRARVVDSDGYGLPRPRGDDADAPRGHRGHGGRDAAHGEPVLAAHRRTARAAHRRGVPRAARRGVLRPTQRDRAHRRRHRVRQPRGQGAVLGCAGGRPPPSSGPRRCGRAPRRPRPGRLAGRPRGRRGRAAAGGRAGPGRPRDRGRGHRARRRGRGADLAHVGQQRDRHGAAPGRDRGAGPRARHPGPLRRGPGRRSAAGRLRGLRARRDDPHRAQAGRPLRGGRPACSAGASSPTPLLHGGGQERDVRSGTLDAPAVAGLLDRRTPRDHRPERSFDPDRAAAGPPGPRGPGIGPGRLAQRRP